MKYSRLNLFLMLVIALMLLSCSKTVEQQMHEYIEFYYPTTGQYTYSVIFDWGEYVITTETPAGGEVHPDSKPYQGYITMRPNISALPNGQKLPVYLITYEGDVWKTEANDNIPETRNRKEVSEEKSASGTMTHTITIESVSEPVIDSYLTNQQAWMHYGKMVPGNGAQSSLELAN